MNPLVMQTKELDMLMIHGNGAKVAQDPLSLPSGPITRLREPNVSRKH
jgi:hypothetical protein